MKPKIYLETSVISHLTAKLSRDVITLGHQQMTQTWWQLRRTAFDLYTSRLVKTEASKGDVQAATKRLAVLQEIPVLENDNEITRLANLLIGQKILPTKAADDAIHVAIATVHQMDYLLTWNCRHLANAEIQKEISKVCTQLGYNMPIICTPEELMGK